MDRNIQMKMEKIYRYRDRYKGRQKDRYEEQDGKKDRYRGIGWIERQI